MKYLILLFISNIQFSPFSHFKMAFQEQQQNGAQNGTGFIASDYTQINKPFRFVKNETLFLINSLLPKEIADKITEYCFQSVKNRIQRNLVYVLTNSNSRFTANNYINPSRYLGWDFNIDESWSFQPSVSDDNNALLSAQNCYMCGGYRYALMCVSIINQKHDSNLFIDRFQLPHIIYRENLRIAALKTNINVPDLFIGVSAGWWLLNEKITCACVIDW